jgi:hypothetical protein
MIGKNEMRVTPDKFDEFEIYKYIRFVNGEVHFCLFSMEHRQLQEEFDNLSPMSAGVIAVKKKSWRIFDRGSITLKIGSLDDDEDVIGKVLEPFGYQYKERHS